MVDMTAEASLAVVGSHGSGVFRRALLGSVSSALAQHADCSVVVVRQSPSHET
jgi:nucleotide-binding universal stress UspA family protein